MTHNEFLDQITRLRNTYDTGEFTKYPSERVALLWEAFKNYSVTEWQDAVSECIAHCERPPMYDALEKALNTARTRSKERSRGNEGGVKLLQPALANADRARALVSALLDRIDGRLSKDEFDYEISKL